MTTKQDALSKALKGMSNEDLLKMADDKAILLQALFDRMDELKAELAKRGELK